jgi:hypothetical protein
MIASKAVTRVAVPPTVIGTGSEKPLHDLERALLAQPRLAFGRSSRAALGFLLLRQLLHDTHSRILVDRSARISSKVLPLA